MSSVSAFVGSIPRVYHECLVPLLFEDYARDIAARLRPREAERILELACGTGIVTRAVVAALPNRATLTATDLNDAMLDVARSTVGPNPAVAFQQADACRLPFPDGSFDALLCQFGVMFFPDKPLAMREARRVLAPGGRYIFNTWDSLEHNPIPRVTHVTIAPMFPADPPTFLKAGPYGYHDRAQIERTLRDAGFSSIASDTVEFPSQSPSAEDCARGWVEGTPLLVALKERGVTDTSPIRTAVAAALAQRFGQRPCRSTMRAFVFTAS